LLDWSHLIEDFLDHLGISLEMFRDEFTGSWMFGYIDALRLVGVRTVLFCVSARVTNRPWRFTHAPTGATVHVLPAPMIYRATRRRVLNPYADTVEKAVGDVHGVDRLLFAALKDTAPYLTTPLRLLARELRGESCDAILCQEYENARFDACVLLGGLMRLPVFATFQGGDMQLSRLERPLRPLTIRACAGLVIAAQSEAQRVRAQYGVPSAKLARIFNPIDVDFWHASDNSEARAELSIPMSARVVVWHGRVLLHRKGLDVLLGAWERVCRERPGRDLRLLLVGTGNDADELRRRIAAKPPPGLRWVDEFVRDRTEIRRYLSAADAYVLPSRHEGFPVAPIEALSCGVPVVATDAPGVPDILEGGETSGGLVVPRNNTAALALALGRVLDDKSLCRELGERARRRVEACFSLSAVGEQLRTFLFSRGERPVFAPKNSREGGGSCVNRNVLSPVGNDSSADLENFGAVPTIERGLSVGDELSL
jgi:glycosyltransferase involved in cell wall biosynthesis